MHHRAVIASVIVVVGLLAGTAGYYVGSGSGPTDPRIIRLETRALAIGALAVIAITAIGVAIAWGE